MEVDEDHAGVDDRKRWSDLTNQQRSNSDSSDVMKAKEVKNESVLYIARC